MLNTRKLCSISGLVLYTGHNDCIQFKCSLYWTRSYNTWNDIHERHVCAMLWSYPPGGIWWTTFVFLGTTIRHATRLKSMARVKSESESPLSRVRVESQVLQISDSNPIESTSLVDANIWTFCLGLRLSHWYNDNTSNAKCISLMQMCCRGATWWITS